MALLTSADFIDEIAIAGLNEPVTSDALTRFIAIYETEFLKRTLGLDLYTAYASGIAAMTPDARWTDLRDGKSYTYAGAGREFKGLKYPAARYVYYHWMKSKGFTRTTPAGEVKAEKGNDTTLPPTHKMVAAWNQMSRELPELWDYLDTYEVSSAKVYPEWAALDVNFKWFQPINDKGI